MNKIKGEIMKFLNWLLKGDNVNLDTLSDLPETNALQEENKTKLKQMMEEIQKEEKVEGYIDSVTGKVYKTEAALKAAQTRRKNAKATKSKAKKTKGKDSKRNT